MTDYTYINRNVFVIVFTYHFALHELLNPAALNHRVIGVNVCFIVHAFTGGEGALLYVNDTQLQEGRGTVIC